MKVRTGLKPEDSDRARHAAELSLRPRGRVSAGRPLSVLSAFARPAEMPPRMVRTRAAISKRGIADHAKPAVNTWQR
jgi:hypothetical protein